MPGGRRTHIVGAILLPPVAFFVSGWLTIVAANNFDVAYAWGISNELANGIPVVVGGLLAGLVFGLLVGSRGLGLLWATVSGLGGLVVYMLLLAAGWDVPGGHGWRWLLVWVGTSLGLLIYAGFQTRTP
jgi:hypothetical protein